MPGSFGFTGKFFQILKVKIIPFLTQTLLGNRKEREKDPQLFYEVRALCNHYKKRK